VKKTLVLAAVILITSLILGGAGCGKRVATKVAAGTEIPTNFNFFFKYGVGARNVLDTFKGTFSKDMVNAPGITIDLVFSPTEMDSIYQKMVEIDFFNYPDEFTVVPPENGITSIVTPFNTYYFEVEYGDGFKTLEWVAEITNPDPKADNLRELIHLIQGIIESKPEYQALPKPSGGYM
jgi:hypothetical protein